MSGILLHPGRALQLQDLPTLKITFLILSDDDGIQICCICKVFRLMKTSKSCQIPQLFTRAKLFHVDSQSQEVAAVEKKTLTGL